MTKATSPFPRRPIPIKGESVYGFERRFASCARYDKIDAFRRAAGLRHFGALSETSKWDRLAEVAGLITEDLNNMRWSVADKDKLHQGISMLGHFISYTNVSHVQTSFCPHCLAEDIDPERRVLRQSWQLRLVTACPRHGSLLVDRCDQCGEGFDHYRKTRPWSCVCDREMTHIETTSAPFGAVRLSLEFMKHLGLEAATGRSLCGGETELPHPFGALSLNDLLLVSAKIGTLAMSCSEDDKPVEQSARVYRGPALDSDISNDALARMMETVYSIMLDWTNGAPRLIASIADRNLRPATDHPVRQIFATDMGYRLLGPLKSLTGQTITVIDDALEQWLFVNRDIYIDNRRRIKKAGKGGIAIDVGDAMYRLEGRKTKSTRIEAWVEADLVKMNGKKVRLDSVNNALEALLKLESDDSIDTLCVEEWISPAFLHPRYTKADALRDIMSGLIRIRHDTRRKGLAAIQVSQSDLINRQLAKQKSYMRKNITPLTDEEIRQKRLNTRVRKIKTLDCFMTAGKLESLLREVFPSIGQINITEEPDIRCRYLVQYYHARKCSRRLYSAMDAINLASKTHAPIAA